MTLILKQGKGYYGIVGIPTFKMTQANEAVFIGDLVSVCDSETDKMLLGPVVLVEDTITVFGTGNTPLSDLNILEVIRPHTYLTKGLSSFGLMFEVEEVKI